MESDTKTKNDALNWPKSMLWAAVAAVCFNAAYASLKYPAAGWLMLGFAYALVRLTEQPSVRRAFYFGLVTGYLCYAPQLFFMWLIFGPFALILWLVLAFWVGLFTAMICGSIKRWGRGRAAWLIPIVWTGLEYFRSELYYLKFSWLNVGYAMASDFSGSDGINFGMYGIGCLIFLLATMAVLWSPAQAGLMMFQRVVRLIVILVIISAMLILPATTGGGRLPPVKVVGLQYEFPPAGILPSALNQALAKATNADIFVLSEYTLEGGVLDSLKDWCRNHQKFLVVGGKDIVTNDVYYNTAFVVDTNGEIVFKQAKSVPIQFFRDGLPATNQALWNSPWGKIGICICYDLSYTRVTDELVRQGAQMLIVPTMDVEEWGRHEHELHYRVAQVRAAEYGIPIFRVASSGISQAVQGSRGVVAETRIGNNGDVLSASLTPMYRGMLPLDRLLAPFCTIATLLFLSILALPEVKLRQKVAPTQPVAK